MPTEKKKEIIDSLEKTFSGCDSGIIADYRGLKTPDIVALRRKFRESGTEFHVVKNSLANIAAKKTGKTHISDIFAGPLAIAFVKDDISKTAKILTDHIASSKLNLIIKGGFMGDRLLTPAEISLLATLPPRPVLLAQVMGGIQGPLYALMGQLNAPLQGLMTILQSRIKQLEGAK